MLMNKYDALFFLGAILALCGAILAAPLQLQGGNNPGIVLLFAGIVVMIFGIAFMLSRK
jgi:hypothetical protein